MVGRALSYPSVGIHDLNAAGHAGHETVDYVVDNLPDMIRSSLTSTIALAGNVDLDPSIVSNMLTAEISSLDDGIKDGLLRLFPDLGAITKLSDAEIRDVINDSDSGGKNSAMLMRCMRGTTVLLSLTDPSGSNLWVASLGDCQAGRSPRIRLNNTCLQRTQS